MSISMGHKRAFGIQAPSTHTYDPRLWGLEQMTSFLRALGCPSVG